MATRAGSFRLFTVTGIDVFIHWSWFLIAAFELTTRASFYQSRLWNLLEYLTLFAIVLAHEFGHAMACRSVGGEAREIVLWPLGGVAYVKPPPRPGPTLWSIAAGPLVNAVLMPLLLGMLGVASWLGWASTMPDLYSWLKAVTFINVALLVFNLAPVYPLDGGQILRALLWFVIGNAHSLLVATAIGFVGVAGLMVASLMLGSPWFAIMAAFMLLGCWRGMKHALALSRIAKLPRRGGFRCPECQSAPLFGAYWQCPECQIAFDTFETGGRCPSCAQNYDTTACADCGSQRNFSEWPEAVGPADANPR